MLLKHGANPSARNYSGYSPLRHAVIQLNKDIIELLLKYEADLYDPNLLILVCRIEDEEIIKLFIDAGADFNIDLRDEPVLNYASKKVKSLIKKDRNCDCIFQ